MISDQQFSYSITTISDTPDFATFQFAPTGVPIPTAPAINDGGQVAFWGATASLGRICKLLKIL